MVLTDEDCDFSTKQGHVSSMVADEEQRLERIIAANQSVLRQNLLYDEKMKLKEKERNERLEQQQQRREEEQEQHAEEVRRREAEAAQRNEQFKAQRAAERQQYEELV